MADFGNSRIPSLMGFGIAILVLAGFGGLTLLATNENLNGNASSSLLKEIEKQNDQIVGLKSRLSKAQERKNRFEGRLEKVNLLTELREEIEICNDDIVQKKAQIDSQRQAFDILFNEHAFYLENYRNQMRSNAVGRVFPSIETKDGEVYQDAKIRKIDERGITVSLADGITRIPYLKLPDELQDEFQFAETKAMKLMLKEKERQGKSSSSQNEAFVRSQQKALTKKKKPNNGPLREKIKELKKRRSQGYLKRQTLEKERNRAQEKHDILRRAGKTSRMPRAIKLLDKKITAVNDELDAVNARISVLTERYKASQN